MADNSTDTNKIALHLGDITKLNVTAIVNAANANLLAGGGVCGAIHRAAGPELERECFTLAGCPTGQARITSGYALPAKYVIHAVGPRWSDGTRSEPELLEQCYKSIFAIAKEHGIDTIAIPAISTGVYRFPLEQATSIAVEQAKIAFKSDPGLSRIVFCCFDQNTFDCYRAHWNGGNGG